MCGTRWFVCVAWLIGLGACARAEEGIRHGFLAAGGQTYLVGADGKSTWDLGESTRDGWVLENGNYLFAISKGPKYPGGGVREITKDGKTVFDYKGTQSEVNTVQALPGGNYLVGEAGARPRLLEIDGQGKTLVEVPLQAQTRDHHLQTRMSRKLPNGNYLVPQLLDRVVREYTPVGKIVWEVKTPHMPFTAIRLPDGNTLIGCTLGDLVIEVDAQGKEVWRVTNEDLPGKPINDACGVQRLKNGNTVITSHHNAAGQTKDDRKAGIHHFQILDTNGESEGLSPLK